MTDGERGAAVADRALLSEVLDRGRIGATYQPIVDLGRGAVVGFEAFVRVPGRDVGAADLFRAARCAGRSDDLEAAALRAALAGRDRLDLPGFLSLNVSAAALARPDVTAVLAEQPSLDGLVLELTDRDPSGIVAAASAIAHHRDRGAAIAVAHHGVGLDDVRAVLEVQPAYVKLDADWVRGLAGDPARIALVELACALATRTGVRVVAQGIETLDDLAALQRLGVGLGQGYLLARPTDDGAHTAVQELTGAARPHAPRQARVTSLLEPAAELALDGRADGSGPAAFEVIVGDLREPLALLRRTAGGATHVPMTVIDAGTSLTSAARLALGRPPATRFDPLVCVDELGAVAGVLPMERLVAALADAVALDRPHHPRPRHPRPRPH